MYHTQSQSSQQGPAVLSIYFLPVLQMFLVLVPVNGEKTLHQQYIMHRWLVDRRFMHEFGFICFLEGAIGMC